MAISPWYVGETRPTWAFTWLDDSKNPINLTGATVVVRFEMLSPTAGAGYPGVGAVVLTVPASGQFTYAPAVADFAAPGNYSVQAKATYGDSTVIDSDPLPLTVLAAV